jgi:putative flavoprotein involved in K+ transport
MHRTDTIIIGAGQAGLAVSNVLTEAGRDHVLLERGRVAERWRSERWDSLHLLTPNWMTRLPNWQYRGEAPDGFMSRREIIEYFDGYARAFAAPVQSQTSVERVEQFLDGYRIVTDRGTWTARDVVIATGATDQPFVPPAGRALAPSIHQLVPTRYRAPAGVSPGGVLVVGASASGVQIADELARDGRDVVLAVGAHTRGVRRYRGRDIFRWLEDTGRNDTPLSAVADPAAAPRAPSLQVVGGPRPREVDLPSLQERGIRLAGRLVAARGTEVEFADDLPQNSERADAQLDRLLRSFDEYAERTGLRDLDPAEPVAPVRLAARPPRRLDLHAERITTVVWATGYRRDYSWLAVPVLDPRRELVQQGGVTPAPGLYVVGLRFQSRRNSNFIDGVRHDARAVVRHLLAREQADMRVAV